MHSSSSENRRSRVPSDSRTLNALTSCAESSVKRHRALPLPVAHDCKDASARELQRRAVDKSDTRSNSIDCANVVTNRKDSLNARLETANSCSRSNNSCVLRSYL